MLFLDSFFFLSYWMFLVSDAGYCLVSGQTNTTTILKEYYPGMNRLMYGVVGGNYEADKHTSALQVIFFFLCCVAD